MTKSNSLKSIDQVLEKYTAKHSSNVAHPSPLAAASPPPLALIDEDLSTQLVTDLKTFITQSDVGDVNLPHAIGLLSKVISKTKPPNDCLMHIIDEELLIKILNSISVSSTSDTVNSVLRLLTFITRGWVFSKGLDPENYLVPVLNSLNETQYKILYVISQKIQGTGSHIEGNLELILKSINLITSFMSINHLQLSSLSNLIEFIFNLQKNEFLLLLINVYRIDETRFNKYVNQPMLQLRETLLNNFNMLNAITVRDYVDTPFIENLVAEIIEDLTKSNNLINARESSAFIRENFSVMQLVDLYVFLKNSNISFKKQFYEQLIFHTSETAQDEIFPLVVVSSKITNILLMIPTNEKLKGLYKIFILKDFFYYNFVLKTLEIWNDSSAKLSDLYKLFSVVDILVEMINDQVATVLETGFFTFDKLVFIFKQITYENIREVELKQIKENLTASLSKQTAQFDQLLKDQVFEFIKNQRIIQLSKGIWAYSSISTEVDNNYDSSAFKYYFIVLSANRKQLLYKEYPQKLDIDPNIDKIGSTLDISSINKIQIELIHQTSKDELVTYNMNPNSRLVNLLEKPTINKVNLLNRKGHALLTVYDAVLDSTHWVDALKMLMGDFDGLSEELKQQGQELFEVRKGIQLINLQLGQEDAELEIQSEEEDEDLYDLENLQDISSGFYYT